MSQPPDGYALTVQVTINVPMEYQIGPRPGWYSTERLSALGFAVEDEAIREAKAAWGKVVAQIKATWEEA